MSVPPSRPTEAELLTPGAVAAVLFVDPKTVTRWARAGKIDSIRTPGGHRRYRRSDIDALRAGDAGRESAATGDAADLPTPIRALTRERGAPPRPGPTSQAAVTGPPWAAVELAEAVAAALELEAEASIATLWRAQAELEAAENEAHEATTRALEARARADAELDRVAAHHQGHPSFPAQRRHLPS